MSVSRRDFLRGMAVAAGGGILAACAPQVVKETVEVEVEKTVEVAVEQTVVVEQTVQVEVEKEVTAVPPPEEAVELRVSHWWGDQGKWERDKAAERVGVELIDETGSFGEYFTKMMTQFAGGVAPDCLLLEARWNATLFQNEVLLPIGDHVKLNVDMTMWAVDPYLENGYQGNLYGLTWYLGGDYFIWFANMDLANELGVADELPLWGRPEYDTWRWEDEDQFYKEVAEINPDGTVARYGNAQDNCVQCFHFLLDLYSVGGKLFEDPYSYNENELLLDTPEVIGVLERYYNHEIVDKVKPGPEETQGTSALYASGLCVTASDWAYVHEVDFEQGYMIEPYAKYRPLPLNGNWWGVNRATEHPTEATDWIIALTTDDEIQQYYIENTYFGGYDVRSHLERMPEGDWKMISEIGASRWEKATSVPEKATDVVEAPTLWGGKAPMFLLDTFEAKWDEVLAGDLTIEECVSQTQAAWEKEAGLA